MDTVRDNKIIISIIVVIFLLVAGSIIQVKNEKDLKVTLNSLNNELSSLKKEIANRESELDEEKSTVIIKSTGLNPKLVEKDKDLTETFFKDAFNWQNGTEYDTARSVYMKYLGDDNTFTKTYLPPDIKIATQDGDLAYIDHVKLKSRLDSMSVIPLNVVDNRIRYVAFVKYYVYKNTKDLVNTKALDASEAIIKFTVAGETDGKREISEVEAWSGFSTLEK